MKHVQVLGNALSAVTLVRFCTMLVSLGIGEVFFKFHSFILECGAFLATWAVLNSVAMVFIKESTSDVDH